MLFRSRSDLWFSQDQIWSDIIPNGGVDLVLSVEPLEVLRYAHNLKPEGWVVASSNPFKNIPEYPEIEGLLSRLAALPQHVIVDAKRLAKAAGSGRAENIVMLGAASWLMPFPDEHVAEVLQDMFGRKGQKIVDVNIRAFDLGRRASAFYRAGLEAGIKVCDVRRLQKRLDPADLEADAAGIWADALNKIPEGEETLPGTADYARSL